ncbi:MAG: alcohol dehydrogenase catalytic domain-containing protein [Anaerolineales bacterium]|nr:alcohol dehydrogenase catalytic domain-containing protein [Anaerolineales bacterium]
MIANQIDLPKTMRSVVCYGPEDYRLEEIAIPTVTAGEVLVRILGAGICAGDAKCFSGAPLFWGDKVRQAYCQPPITPGHEFVGEVVALGAGAAEKYNLEIGNLAISEQIVPCWECRFCQRGQYWMCDKKHDVYGFRQRTPGAMAEYMRFPADAINYRVPDSLTPRQAVYIEPLACAIHAVQRGEIEFGDTVVISGCGSLGLGMVAAARLKNPGCLIALDLQPSRLEVAKKCGADLVLNPLEVDVVDEVRKITDGYGCDVYIEATGHPKSVTQGLHMIRRLGTFVEFSVFGEPVTVDWTIIGDTKELNIHGAHLGPYCYPLAIDMLVKEQVPVDDIVTHALPLEQFEDAFQLVHDSVDAIKVMLTP